MPLYDFPQTLISSVGVGPTITATTISSVLPTPSVWAVPGNFMVQGKKLRGSANGVMNTTVTTPGTLIWTINVGAVAVFISQALALNIIAKAQVQWQLEFWLECMSAGSGTIATLKGHGFFKSEAVVGSPLPAAGGSGSLLMPLGAPVAGTGFNSITPGSLDLLATNSVNNSMICHGYHLEALN